MEEAVPELGTERPAAGPVADEGGALRAGPSDPSSTPIIHATRGRGV